MTTKVQAPARTESSPETAQEPEREPSPRREGRLPTAPVARAALPPPNGQPREVHAAGVLRSAEFGASNRARMSGALQRMVGNGRLAEMSQPGPVAMRSAEGVKPDSASAGDPLKPAGIVVQTKLTVNSPGDVYEQEADRVAGTVMRMHDAPASSGAPPQVEHRCPECQRAQRLCPECAKLNRKENAGGTPEVSPETEREIHSRRGGGQPLARSAREFLEPRFGQDFGGVRVHADTGAARLARQLNAHAFTTGNDIFFGEGRYQPHTNSGRTLLAHELTHTVQQGAAPVRVSRDGDAPAPSATPQPVKDAVDIIIDALRGITTAWGSERIVKQFRGQNPPFIRALMQEIKARAGDNDETPQGMITWLFGDLTAEDRRELRRILIKARVLDDLGPILIDEIVKDLGGVFSGGTDTFDILSQFGGTDLDDMLRRLETATKKSEEDLPAYLFSNLDRATAEKLRGRFVTSGGPLANKFAAYWTAARIHKLVSGFLGLVSHSESTMVVDLFRSVPAELLPSVQARLDELFQQSDGKKAEDMLMLRLDQSDYEVLQSLPGVTLRKYDRKTDWTDTLASGAKWALTFAQWIVCGLVGIVTGILAAAWDLIKGLWDIVKAAYHLIGALVYLISGFSFGRDHWVAVRDFFVSLGTMFAHPINTFDKMWDELVLDFATIEGPFADCKRAEFVVRKFIGVVVNIILIFVAGYGIAKAAVAVVAEVAELAETVGLLRAIGQTIRKAGRAIKLVPAKVAGELGEVARAFLKPAQTLLAVKRRINGLLLAVDKEGVWSYLRGRGGDLLANEREFWQKNRDKWRDRGVKTQEKQAAAEEQLGQINDGLENNQVPANKEAEVQDLDRKATEVKGEGDALEKEMKSDPEKGKETPPPVPELPKEYLEWENGLSKETQEALRADPELRRTYAQMDPEVRRLLTLCESPCIPTKPPPSAEDIAHIRELLDKLKLPENHPGLREYFHYANRKGSLTTAVNDLKDVKSVTELNAKLDEFVIRKAEALGVAASKGPDGRWVAKINGLEVKEWEIGSYQYLGDNRGTNSFFQAHHGVQDNWAKTRLPGVYDSGEAPTILLRDRHAGSPHQRLTARQVGSDRATGIPNRTYQDERALTAADLKIADVPDAFAKQFLDAADKYFGDLYRRLESTMTADQLKAIFGGWKP